MLKTEDLTYEQLKILTGHAQADQVLMKSMATLLYGADFRPSFTAMSELTYENVRLCAKKLLATGIKPRPSLFDIEQFIAHNFAERFAHHWPELNEKVMKHAEYLSSKQVRS